MSRSKLARLTIGPQAYTPTGLPQMSLLFSSFKPNNRQEVIDIGRDLGGFGNLNHPVDLTRKNVRRCAPTARLKPSVDELVELLPWILNTVGLGTGPYAYTPDVPAKLRWLEYTDASAVVHRLLGLAVSKATFSAQAAQELVLDLELQGTDWTNPGGTTYPNWGNKIRFLFGDLGLTLNGVATPCRSFRLTVDHGIQNDRFYAGFVSAGPLNTDRTVMLDLEIPYGLAVAAWAAGQADGGVPATLAFVGVNGAVTSQLTIYLPAVRYAHPSVDAEVPNEQFIAVQAQCFGPTAGGGPVLPYTGAEIVAALTLAV